MERPLAERRGDQPGKGNLERTGVHGVVEQRVRRRLIQLPTHGVYRVHDELGGVRLHARDADVSAAAAELARTCGLSESELTELLRRKWEGSL